MPVNPADWEDAYQITFKAVNYSCIFVAGAVLVGVFTIFILLHMVPQPAGGFRPPGDKGHPFPRGHNPHG